MILEHIFGIKTLQNWIFRSFKDPQISRPGNLGHAQIDKFVLYTQRT